MVGRCAPREGGKTQGILNNFEASRTDSANLQARLSPTRPIDAHQESPLPAGAVARFFGCSLGHFLQLEDLSI
jgi:hypothetical protein